MLALLSAGKILARPISDSCVLFIEVNPLVMTPLDDRDEAAPGEF
jgi:hypothetical protein